MTYVKQICDGYSKKSLLGNWYEERIYPSQPFRQQPSKNARSKDQTISCFDETGFQRALPRIQRRNKWVTQGRIILDDGYKLPVSTIKGGHSVHELNTSAQLTTPPFDKNIIEMHSTELHPHTQLRVQQKDIKMLNLSTVQEIKKERNVAIHHSDFKSILPQHPQNQKYTNFVSTYNHNFSKLHQVQNKLDSIVKAGNFNQNPEEAVKATTTLIGQFKKEKADEKEMTGVQRSWIPPRDKSLSYSLGKTADQFKKGSCPKNDIQTSLNLNIGLNNIHPKNVPENYFGHVIQDVTKQTLQNTSFCRS